VGWELPGSHTASGFGSRTAEFVDTRRSALAYAVRARNRDPKQPLDPSSQQVARLEMRPAQAEDRTIVLTQHVATTSRFEHGHEATVREQMRRLLEALVSAQSRKRGCIARDPSAGESPEYLTEATACFSVEFIEQIGGEAFILLMKEVVGLRRETEYD
jgi:hypothetical protein